MTTLALPAGTLAQLTPLKQVVFGYLARCRCEATRRAYEEDLKNFLAWCDWQQLEPLSAQQAHLDLYRGWMQQQDRWAESTISRRLGTVCGLYKYATRTRAIQWNPAEDLERPGVDRAKQRRTWLSGVELAILLRTTEQIGPREHGLVVILGGLGLRVGEMCSLNVEAITLERGYTFLNFLGKGGAAAHVDIPVPWLPAIHALIDGRNIGPLMLNQADHRMDRACAARLLKKLCAAADLPADISPHSLRRSFVTTGLTNGISIYDMQRAARHKSPQTTALYDMTANSPSRNATHQVAGYLNAMTG